MSGTTKLPYHTTCVNAVKSIISNGDFHVKKVALEIPVYNGKSYRANAYSVTTYTRRVTMVKRVKNNYKK